MEKNTFDSRKDINSAEMDPVLVIDSSLCSNQGSWTSSAKSLKKNKEASTFYPSEPLDQQS